MEYNYIKCMEQYQQWLFIDENGAKSRLYIQNWRVPDYIPKKVKVTVLAEDGLVQDYIVSEKDVCQSSEVKNDKISIIMKYISKHFNTVRYDTIEEKSGINSLYIPDSFFESEIYPNEIKIIIEWC